MFISARAPHTNDVWREKKQTRVNMMNPYEPNSCWSAMYSVGLKLRKKVFSESLLNLEVSYLRQLQSGPGAMNVLMRILRFVNKHNPYHCAAFNVCYVLPSLVEILSNYQT